MCVFWFGFLFFKKAAVYSGHGAGQGRAPEGAVFTLDSRTAALAWSCFEESLGDHSFSAEKRRKMVAVHGLGEGEGEGRQRCCGHTGIAGTLYTKLFEFLSLEPLAAELRWTRRRGRAGGSDSSSAPYQCRDGRAYTRVGPLGPGGAWPTLSPVDWVTPFCCFNNS